MKTLIAFYSQRGHTKTVAEQLHSMTESDIFEIKSEKDYGGYLKAVMIARKEFSAGELPKVTARIDNQESYDRILLGFPVWYGKAPQLVMSFLSEYDWTGKEIYPFCTSGTSGPEKSDAQLKQALGSASIHKGVRFTKQLDADKVAEWLK